MPAPVVQTKPATRADVDALLADMHASLAGTLLPDAPLLTRAALGAAQGMLQKANITHDRLQTILVVDRSPKVQRLWVTVASSSSPYLEVLGSVHVSTGKPGRKEHFRTPVGVFVDNAGILGYRAQGTYNEFHIRGIGVKGMRVWDFGWQTTDDWRTPNAIMAVRMEMHATDPAVLEPRLGRWDSEGCIRIPTRFNSFLDPHRADRRQGAGSGARRSPVCRPAAEGDDAQLAGRADGGGGGYVPNPVRSHPIR